MSQHDPMEFAQIISDQWPVRGGRDRITEAVATALTSKEIVKSKDGTDLTARIQETLHGLWDRGRAEGGRAWLCQALAHDLLDDPNVTVAAGPTWR